MFDEIKKDAEFRYRLLDRCIQDCNYFLGYGSRLNKHLYAGNVNDQINLMKELYNSFPDSEKPEWTNMKEIEGYEIAMKNK